MTKPHSSNQLTLVFIVNGVETAIVSNVNAPLRAAVERALGDTGNTGRDIGDWEVRDVGGVALEVSRKIEDLGLADGARVFLSLRVGAGGS